MGLFKNPDLESAYIRNFKIKKKSRTPKLEDPKTFFPKIFFSFLNFFNSAFLGLKVMGFSNLGGLKPLFPKILISQKHNSGNFKSQETVSKLNFVF